jgi:arylsulfatase A-like enzyme
MRVLVITARGLRADYLGCYGNPRVETPALDGLAAGGIVFDRHFADAADPAGARRSWRSGRYLFPGTGPPPGSPDLVTLLNARGVATCLIEDASRTVPPGFNSGWQTAETVEPNDSETPLESAVAAARAALLRLRRSESWLIWLDVATPLPPWDVPEDFAGHYFRDEVLDDEEDEEDEEGLDVELEPLTPLPDPPLGPVDAEDDTLYLRIQGSYSAAVTYFDAGLAELLRNVEDDVAVLVTSDAGFALGEHGFVGPGLTWPAESVTQLPLVVRLPAGSEAGRRVPALTQAVDLAPTLAALFGVDFPVAHGHDLAPLIHGKADSIRPYAVSWITVGDKIGRALRSPEWSFILPPADAGEVVPHLYARPDDHWEVNDVRQHHLELTEAWEPVLREFESAAGRPGALDVPALPDPEAVQATSG